MGSCIFHLGELRCANYSEITNQDQNKSKSWGRNIKQEDERKVKKNPCLFFQLLSYQIFKGICVGQETLLFSEPQTDFLIYKGNSGGLKTKWPQGRMSKSIVSEKTQ